jgi:hypothetical protein
MEMDEIITRWQHAAERAADEQVRVLAIGGDYRATSSSHPLGSYLLHKTPAGWACECVANGEYGMPCKHLWALAEALGLDVLSDMRIAPSSAESPA